MLLNLPPERLARRVLHLEPIRRSPRNISRVLALRHDAFEAERARVLEDRSTVAFAAVDPFVGQHAWPAIGKQPAEIGLALRKRIAAAILAVQLDQVECIEEHTVISST